MDRFCFGTALCCTGSIEVKKKGVSVLADFAAPPNGIYAVFPHARYLALRVRLWIDFLKHSYGDINYWQRQT